MPMRAGIRVLIVVADATMARRLATALETAGYDVIVTTDGLDGLVAIEEDHPALVVLDWALPFIDGPIFLHALRAGLPAPPPVLALLDATTDPAEAQRLGVLASLVLVPSTDTDQLVQLVHTLLLPPASTA